MIDIRLCRLASLGQARPVMIDSGLVPPTER
jgi:hypothetical protein